MADDTKFDALVFKVVEDFCSRLIPLESLVSSEVFLVIALVFFVSWLINCFLLASAPGSLAPPVTAPAIPAPTPDAPPPVIVTGKHF